MEVTEQDLHNLYTWIDDIPLTRPKRNFTRDFSDGVLMAEVMRYYFPKLVELHNYSSANGSQQKAYNWDTLNRKVFMRLGIQVSQEHLNAIVNSEPRAVECLLKAVRVEVLRRQAMKATGHSAGDVTPPPPPSTFGFEHGDDVNNRHAMSRLGNGGHKGKEHRHGHKVSQIPRAPSQLSMTPPPEAQAMRRPKSSFDVCSSNEKDLMIKELQETNELLMAKISKLEQLLNLKDKKIERLVERLQTSNNSCSVSPSP